MKNTICLPVDHRLIKDYRHGWWLWHIMTRCKSSNIFWTWKKQVVQPVVARSWISAKAGGCATSGMTFLNWGAGSIQSGDHFSGIHCYWIFTMLGSLEPPNKKRLCTVRKADLGVSPLYESSMWRITMATFVYAQDPNHCGGGLGLSHN